MKHAVVIGGTSGIGAGVVRVLVRDGWKVITTGVTEAEVIEFAENNPDVAAHRLDVTDQDGVATFFSEIESLQGLVNCAGILMREREYELDVFQKVIDINLTGTMRTCLAAHELLAESAGAIVNTASMLSYFGGPLVPAYSASKGGVSQLTKALAGKWAADGVRVNAVAPGWIATPMTEALQTDPSRNDPIMARTPLNRWGDCEEVGELVAWLLSEKAAFVTGRWHYLERDWEATPGSYVYEPPGETHTLIVPDGVDEMITYFQVNGVMCYVDPYGEVLGYEDVFTKIDLCRKHYAEVGLGEDFVDQFIR
eukprot:g16975.t1